MKVTLVKLTPKGMDDVVVSEGLVPEEKLAAIYQAVNVKQKSTKLAMKSKDGSKVVGELKVKIMFTTELLKKKGEEEEKKEDELVPIGNQLAASSQN